MVAVANVRVNTQAPFPTQVVGTGPITLSKSVGGIWQIGANGRIINTGNPGLVATDYVLVWDDVAQAWLKISLPNLISTAAQARVQRSITSSPIVISGTDQILNVNISGGTATCALPQASTRAGLALTFKDVGSHFATIPLAVTPFSGDTIDGQANLILNLNRQAVTIVPFNDGVNTGWAVE